MHKFIILDVDGQSLPAFEISNQMLGQTTKSIVVVIRMDNLFNLSNITIQFYHSKVSFKRFSR